MSTPSDGQTLPRCPTVVVAIRDDELHGGFASGAVGLAHACAFGPFDQRGGGDGGRRLGTSVYTRDPDGNLLEFMTYPASGRYPMVGV